MGFLRIHCDYCGGTWDVYGHSNFSDKSARTCPHCKQKMDETTWAKILPAYGAMAAFNKRLAFSHVEQRAPLFTVDYIEDYIYTNAQNAAISDLQSRIDELKSAFDMLLDTITTGQDEQPGKEQE